MTAWGIVGAVSPTLTNWLTPLWLLGVGVLVGLALLLLLWGLAFVASRLTPRLAPDSPRSVSARGGFGQIVKLPLVLISRRTVSEIPQAVREGPLWPLLIVAIVLAAFGISGALFVREPLPLLRSMARLPAMGTTTVEGPIPVSLPENRNDKFSEPVAHEFAVSFRQDEIRHIVFRSDQHLTIATRPFPEVKPGAEIEFAGGRRSSLDCRPAECQRVRRSGCRAVVRAQSGQRACEIDLHHHDRASQSGGGDDSDYGVGRRGGVPAVPAPAVRCAASLGHCLGDAQVRDRSAAVSNYRCRRRGVAGGLLPLDPVQHVRRRHQDAERLGIDADHDPGRDSGGMGRQHFDQRRNRRTHGPDGAVETHRSSFLHPGQVPRHLLDRGRLVRRLGRVVFDHDRL